MVLVDKRVSEVEVSSSKSLQCHCYRCVKLTSSHSFVAVFEWEYQKSNPEFMCVLCSVWLVLDTYCKFYARHVFYTSCVYGLHVMWLNMCFVHV